ncbi:uncharacterized protein LOC143848240 isoform X5 [Tasmannia lanceolata]|uniref:uncharacterized protein LOC143848240 isoform X5 n=1 Tax=Tasmannia lanceolata TaxID=3420 RepID=UPI0040633C91
MTWYQGNNRTRSVLVGLRGVVEKAVGLGSWHWLVLTNGDEVKLQRNALSVIEVPREEEIYDCGDVSFSGSDLGSRNTPRRALTVDLRKLETAALWRYWRHFKLDDMSFHPSKEQLVEAVERHFLSQVEAQTITQLPVLIIEGSGSGSLCLCILVSLIIEGSVIFIRLTNVCEEFLSSRLLSRFIYLYPVCQDMRIYARSFCVANHKRGTYIQGFFEVIGLHF